MAPERENSPGEGAGWPGFALFAAAFCLYIITSAPAMGWLDAPEFVAQAVSLGVAHSPGHPLPALLGKFASFLPVGDLVWRVNLMSSLCSAGALVLLFACGRTLLGLALPSVPESSRRTMALIFACIAGLSWALWSNAVRAEVYALQALLSSGAFLALLRYEADKRPRHLMLASFFLALGLANHHLMALTILLPAGLYVMVAKSRPGLRLAGWVAGIGVVALLSLAYLPIRSLAHPEVNFGAPHTVERFFWTLRGAAFSKSAYNEHMSTPFMDSVQVLVGLADALTLPLLLLAAIGMVHLLRSTRLRRLGSLLIGITLLCCAARVILGFDPETPDHHAYLLPAIFSLFLLAQVGVAQLCHRALLAKRPLPKAPPLACVALSLLIPIQLVANYEESNSADAWASDDLAHWEMENLPPHSLLLVAYFQTSFRQWALHAVEGTRPDVAILDRSFLTHPGMPDEAKRRNPELAELIDAPLVAGAQTPTKMLTAMAKERSIFAQLHANVGPGLAASVTPAGAYARYVGPDSNQDLELLAQKDMQVRQKLAALLRSSSSAERGEAKRALLWHDAMRLDQYCRERRLGPAARVYADAKALAPHDLLLREMGKACGLTVAE